MRRTRQVLAVMLVATALCADRGAAALSSAPARAHPADPAKASLATRIIRGLSRTLGQSADVVLARQAVRTGRAVVRGPAPLADQSPGPLHPAVSPFQSRLPPPAC